ncbi:MAG: GNAT family N-acetyltransferase [Alphaproteobacteria bacterium]|nr:GNAT family N-acetyltransferase [Alphaproteobacteria bacterium]
MPASDGIEQVFYSEAPPDLRRRFALLRHRADPVLRPMPGETVRDLHDPALSAVSFYTCSGEAVISYAAVLRKTIRHAAQTFEIAGLSAVLTDPEFRGRGFGRRTVAAATRWIGESGADLGLFTCDPPLARFYARAGAWPVAGNIVLIGGRSATALRSDMLGKVVLMRLFTPHAMAAEPVLSQATIDLDLPDGQFL